MKKHAFAICAYKESPFLGECIESLLAQEGCESEVYIATSTPCDWISTIAKQYSLPLYVNEVERGIGQDWNFAVSKTSCQYVTVAHQDDVYLPRYAAKAVEMMEAASHPLVFFSNYGEIRAGEDVDDDKLLRVKRRLLKGLADGKNSSNVKTRRRALSFGSAICCPSVTLCMSNCPAPPYTVGMKSNLDWDTWERISRMPGDFLYSTEILMRHRIHEGSTTSALIKDNTRAAEDLEMLERFWPKPVARAIDVLYASGTKSNAL